MAVPLIAVLRFPVLRHGRNNQSAVQLAVAAPQLPDAPYAVLAFAVIITVHGEAFYRVIFVGVVILIQENTCRMCLVNQPVCRSAAAHASSPQ